MAFACLSVVRENVCFWSVFAARVVLALWSSCFGPRALVLALWQPFMAHTSVATVPSCASAKSWRLDMSFDIPVGFSAADCHRFSSGTALAGRPAPTRQPRAPATSASLLGKGLSALICWDWFLSVAPRVVTGHCSGSTRRLRAVSVRRDSPDHACDCEDPCHLRAPPDVRACGPSQPCERSERA